MRAAPYRTGNVKRAAGPLRSRSSGDGHRSGWNEQETRKRNYSGGSPAFEGPNLMRGIEESARALLNSATL